MKIYSNGKDRVIKGNFPARFKLLNAGVEVPFIRTGKQTLRLSGDIPYGELDVEEIAHKKVPQPAKLDSGNIAIINKKDFDYIDILSKKLTINQEQMNNHLSALTEQEATLANLETQNSQAIDQTNLNMVEMAKVFGKEIQADRDSLKATSENIKQVLSETAEVLDAKLQAHEVAKNPHKISKEMVGLGSVDNTSDLDKPVSKATQKALDKKADKSDIENLDKRLLESDKKQDTLMRNLETVNLYGGVGGNELPTGGKIGQILSKASNKTGDYKWIDQESGIEIIRVDELPSTGKTNILYLVPVDEPEESNIYDEYIWTIKQNETYGWEKIGSTKIDLSDYVPYSGATGAVDLNAQDLKNVDNLAVGTATVDNNEKILSVGQNRIVTNNQNGLFISSTTSQARKGMYGVPMALEIQFNSNNQAYSYPLGFHDMNSNNNGGQFLFTSFSSNIGAATAGDVMVENDKGGLIFNTGNSKSGSKMRFTVGNWQATPQLTLTANCVGVKTTNPNSSYALDVNGTLNATGILINGEPIDVGGDANVQYTAGGGSEFIDLSELYVDSQGATYGFSYDGMSETIKNNNVQVDESFAYGYIELYTENDGDITISFSQDSEQNYDFGEISELDQYLNQDNYEDTDYVAWSGKDYGSISDSITFSNVTAGYHFFTIKYIKDSSSESGTDTFEITSIEVGGSAGGSLIDTNTQEEIPLSQINDMPQALQAIRDEIPDTSNFVTIDTKQMMTAPKAITGTDTPWGSDQVQKNLFMAVSNSNTTSAVEWIGRSMFGANNLTFLMGTINKMAALGAHSWTSAKQGTGAAWADIYINPDGDKAVKIGGSPMVGRPSIMVIQNMGQTTTGTVKINRRPQLTQSALYKDVACWDDNVSKFNNDAGYITSSDVHNPTITITQGGVTKGSFTLNQSSASTIALDAGGGGSYTSGTGIDITNDVISVTSPTLTNKSTNANSLTILGTATTANNATNIGKDSSASVPGVAVGGSSSISGSNWPSVYGFGATAENSFCGVAIGSYAKVTANNAIQIGGSNTTTASVNSTANTMSVYNGIDNYRLLNSDGTIPSARYDKATIVGWGMPDWDSAVSLSTTVGSTYTCPSDGFLFLSNYNGVTSLRTSKNSNVLYIQYGTYAYTSSAIYPVVSGEVLTVDANSGTGKLYFLKAKGV